MRFVVPETKRIDLRDGPDGEKNWIEIKKELTKGEDSTFRTRAMKAKVQPGETQGTVAVEIDWKLLALARVEAFLVDWSAKGPNGKDLPVTPEAIAALAPESFDEIDESIQAHIAALEAEKKQPSGNRSLTTT